jgi:hypothetical protein
MSVKNRRLVAEPVAVLAVLREAFEKAATVRALFMRVDVGDGFEERDNAKPLPLGPLLTEPAGVGHD